MASYASNRRYLRRQIRALALGLSIDSTETPNKERDLARAEPSRLPKFRNAIDPKRPNKWLRRTSQIVRIETRDDEAT